MPPLPPLPHLTFALLRDRLDITAPDLSKHLRALVDAGYMRTSKTGRGPGSESWGGMTRAGRQAYEDHVAALRELLDPPPASR